MRAVESWQTNRKVVTSIQRIPVLIAAPLAASTGPEEACLGEAIGSPGELAAAGIVLFIQCSKQRFRNRRAEAVAERRGFFQAKTGLRHLAEYLCEKWTPNPGSALALLPGPLATSIIESLRRQPGITPARVPFRDGCCRARHPGGALPATLYGGVPKAARGRPE